jgi:Raf kinase inhibitor-like YbhB/YbcL family protein
MQPHIEPTAAPAKLIVTSDAFSAGGAIPLEYTADGADISPPIAWGKVPPGTKSIAILAEDLDAPRRIFVHWIVVGIPPDMTELGAGADAILPGDAVHGTNDFGDDEWGGPAPPSGRHRYVFHVFALDYFLDREGMTKPQLMSAIKGHVLGEGQLTGTYAKRD